jgi:Metal-independent alpha-mannosidase (GH125)
VPAALSDLASDVRGTLGAHPAAALVEDCLTNTWTTTMRWSRHGDGEVFVATGDIPAMWLRDSTAQVRPYLAAAHDPEVADAIAGVSRRQVRCALTDPYANAFNDGPDGRHGDEGRPVPGPWVWERKYEVDSLARRCNWRTRCGGRPAGPTTWTSGSTPPPGRSSTYGGWNSGTPTRRTPSSGWIRSRRTTRCRTAGAGRRSGTPG